jgi:hypothetical protein
MGNSENELAIARLADRHNKLNRRKQSMSKPWVTTIDGAYFVTEPLLVPALSADTLTAPIPTRFVAIFNDGNEFAHCHPRSALPSAVVDAGLVPHDKLRFVTWAEIDREYAMLEAESRKLLDQPIADDVDDMRVDQLRFMRREARRYFPTTPSRTSSRALGIVPQVIARTSGRAPRMGARRRRATATARSPGRSTDPDDPAPPRGGLRAILAWWRSC